MTGLPEQDAVTRGYALLQGAVEHSETHRTDFTPANEAVADEPVQFRCASLTPTTPARLGRPWRNCLPLSRRIEYLVSDCFLRGKRPT